MVGDQHANTLLGQRGHRVLQVRHGNRVDASKGFVQQEDARLGGQRAGNLGAAAFPSRQRQGQAVCQVRNRQFIQQFRRTVFTLCPRQGLILEHRQQVLLHSQLPKHRGLLRQVGHARARALVHGVLGHVVACKEHLPRIGPHKTHRHAEGGRLACAIRTQQPHHLARMYGDRHAADHGAFAIRLDQGFRM